MGLCPERALGEGTISLCLIVRDEEENLGRCLASARDSVDEIVVVDTGSRDGTVRVATEFGAGVAEVPWEGDFSRARNASLDGAGGQWVLVLDADEELPPETAGALRRLAAEPAVEGWIFAIVSPVTRGEEPLATRHAGLRMFRNRPAYRFEGRIHEQVRPSILRANPQAAGTILRHSGLTILHHGYLQDGRDGSGRGKIKRLRNIELLQAALKDDPEDHFSRFNLGTSLMNAGRLTEAAAHFAAALAGAGNAAVPVLYRNYGLCLHDLGEYATAMDVLEQGLSLFPDYPDLYFVKGQVFWEIGFLSEAERCFKKCTRFRRVPPEYTTMEGVTTDLAWENLAEVYAKQGRPGEAVEALARVGGGGVRSAPRSRRLIRKACGFLRQAGVEGPALARRVAESFGAGGRPAVDVLFEAGDAAAALAALGCDLPDDPPRRARCLMKLERFAQAWDVWMAYRGRSGDGGSPPPLDSDQLVDACLCAWLDEPRRSASADLLNAPPDHAPAMAAACRWVEGLLGLSPGTAGDGPLTDDGRRHTLEIATRALSLGDVDLATCVVRSWGSPDASDSHEARGEACFVLGRAALDRGLPGEARLLLERAVNRYRMDVDAGSGAAAAGGPLDLLGKANAQLGDSAAAFRAFLGAFREALKEGDGGGVRASERLAFCALEQLAARCQELCLRALSLDQGNTELHGLVFALASLRTRAARLGAEPPGGRDLEDTP